MIMRVRPDEEAAANLLGRLLKRLGVKASWRPGPDPPDTIFTVEDRGEWAVEVTGLHQYISTAEGAESRAGATVPLFRMCERVKSTVAEQKNLDYLIFANGPLEARLLRDVEKRAVEFIRSKRTGEITLDDEGLVRIRCKSSPPKIEWMIGLDRTSIAAGTKTVSADIAETVKFALDRILKKKIPRLVPLTGFDRRMLLITKNYLFVTPEDVKNVLDQHASIEPIDAVLLATEDDVHWVADPHGIFGSIAK